MLKELLRPEIEELIQAKNWGLLRETLELWPSPELSDLLLSLPKSDRVLFFRALPRDQAADVFSHLDLSDQDELLHDLSDEETRHVLAGLTPEEAHDFFGAPRKDDRPAYRSPAPARRPFAPPSSPEWKLLSYVVARPVLAAEIDTSLIDMRLPESQALKALADRFLAEGGNLTGGMLVEHFQGGPHAEILFAAQANEMEGAESEEHARLQVQHALWKLEINRKNSYIKALGEKLRQGKLSKEEHLQYGRMISEVKALELRLQSEGRAATR